MSIRTVHGCPGRIVGGGTIGGKATFHVQPVSGAKETVDNMNNIVSAADGMKAGYFNKNYPNMTLSAPVPNTLIQVQQ